MDAWLWCPVWRIARACTERQGYDSQLNRPLEEGRNPHTQRNTALTRKLNARPTNSARRHKVWTQLHWLGQLREDHGDPWHYSSAAGRSVPQYVPVQCGQRYGYCFFFKKRISFHKTPRHMQVPIFPVTRLSMAVPRIEHLHERAPEHRAPAPHARHEKRKLGDVPGMAK
jgi:hypothetical protein